jgi:hypothetical protein
MVKRTDFAHHEKHLQGYDPKEWQINLLRTVSRLQNPV